MATGECNCGAVAFDIAADLADVFVCHCSICRRSTGSNGIAVVVVDNEAFRWTRGEAHIETWKKPGADWQTWFCRTCGSTLPGANDPHRMFVPAGLISDGGDALRVRHHLWVDSKACWDEYFAVAIERALRTHLPLRYAAWILVDQGRTMFGAFHDEFRAELERLNGGVLDGGGFALPSPAAAPGTRRPGAP